MDQPQRTCEHADRWLAVIRFAVGLWFLKSVVTKLQFTVVGDVFPIFVPTERWVGFMPGRVLEFAAGDTTGWYGAFLTNVVVPNGALFAALTAYGEAVVGVGLTLGLLTRYAALIGLFLSLNYLLATWWMSSSQMGFHLLLATCMIAFIGAAAGRTWGLDGLFRSRAATRAQEGGGRRGLAWPVMVPPRSPTVPGPR